MSKIEIDFNNLNYNLYELLNVPYDATEQTIKKNFIKVTKTFHPDKNSELEEDIYYHIVLANQILTNKDLRNKYDLYLKEVAETFNDLKNNYNKFNKSFVGPNEKESIQKFKIINEELNNKHGYNNNNNNNNIIDKFNKMKECRDIEEMKIEKEDIKNSKEFNIKFNNNKLSGKYKDQIIEYKGELTTYNGNDTYTNLADIDKLYIEDSILTNKYSSLDKAFTIQPIIEWNNTKTIEEKMKEYKSDKY
jgi:DnaJ-class molecular chaperone